MCMCVSLLATVKRSSEDKRTLRSPSSFHRRRLQRLAVSASVSISYHNLYITTYIYINTSPSPLLSSSHTFLTKDEIKTTSQNNFQASASRDTGFQCRRQTGRLQALVRPSDLSEDLTDSQARPESAASKPRPPLCGSSAGLFAPRV